MSDRESFRESVGFILMDVFTGDVLPYDAEASIIKLIKGIVPKEKVCKSKKCDCYCFKIDHRWNACRTKFLKKLRSVK